jgi:tryptophan-rich sensory protein
MTTDVARDDRGFWKKALWTVPLIVGLGSLSGILSNSGFGNPWFDALAKPSFMPPGWAFGAAWTTLYTMLGIALATVLNEPRSKKRTSALLAFAVQLILNFSWSPIFFAGHDIKAAGAVIVAMLIAAAIALGKFWRLRPLAGALMIPYLGWLMFAATLTYEIGRLNPGASEPLLLKLIGG